VLRGAFIGFGNVAANGHLPGWQANPEVEIVAATDGTPARREVLQTACPKARWFESADALLAAGTQLDFVDICTPPGSHEALIRLALDAGLHVLCEKPLVTGPAGGVAAAAARAGRVLHTVHNWLEAPICRRISALIADGAIGAVRRVRWETLRSRPAVAVTTPGASNWRVDPALAGGGILVDHGWHALYCVLRWAGAAPGSVAARLETRRHREWPLEDTATVDLEFPAGHGRIFLTWAADERANRIEIEGERARIHIEGENVILENAAGERRWRCPPALSEGSHHPDWFAGVAADFLAAIAGGGKGNLDEALLCARLIALAQRSSAAGGERLAI
jgi:predicted dehydrogenase